MSSYNPRSHASCVGMHTTRQIIESAEDAVILVWIDSEIC